MIRGVAPMRNPTVRTCVDEAAQFWVGASAVSLGSVMFLITMEWLFLATKKSFLSARSIIEKFRILAEAAAVPVASALLLATVLTLLVAIAPRLRRAANVVVGVGSAIIGSLALLLLYDNFVTTFFAYHVVDTRRVWRLLIALLFLSAIVATSRRLIQCLNDRMPRPHLVSIVTIGLLLIILPVGFSGATKHVVSVSSANRPLPNIILIGVDGVEAAHMSLYGYHRPTTPHLSRLAHDSLVLENAYSNASPTHPSTATVLTGRHAYRIGVVGPGEILSDADVFRHLPGLLRHAGYRTGQFSSRYVADALDLNLVDGFDLVNGRTVDDRWMNSLVSWIGPDGTFLLSHVTDRISIRVGHLSRLPSAIERRLGGFSSGRISPGVFQGDLLRNGDGFSQYDQQSIDRMIEFAEESDAPFFAHLFLLGTHGPHFAHRHPQFSRGKTQNEPWMTDFYDDAIREADEQVGRILEWLMRSGRVNDTILAIYSDHGQRWSIGVRTPLVFRFPARMRISGRRSDSPSQNIDIAPTLLSALGISVPAWMDGASLLFADPDPCRWIIATRADWNFYEPVATKERQLSMKTPIEPLAESKIIVGDRTFHWSSLTGFREIASDEAGMDCSSRDGLSQSAIEDVVGTIRSSVNERRLP